MERPFRAAYSRSGNGPTRARLNGKTADSPCSPITQAWTLPGMDAELLGEELPQPPRIKGSARAEHVDAPRRPRAREELRQDVHGVRDHNRDPRQGPGQRVRQLGGHLQVVIDDRHA